MERAVFLLFQFNKETDKNQFKLQVKDVDARFPFAAAVYCCKFSAAFSWQWQLKGGKLFFYTLSISRPRFSHKKILRFLFRERALLALFCCSGGEAGGYGVIKFGSFFPSFSLSSSALTTKGENISCNSRFAACGEKERDTEIKILRRTNRSL